MFGRSQRGTGGQGHVRSRRCRADRLDRVLLAHGGRSGGRRQRSRADQQPDPASGAWLQFPGPAGERLVRIGERGSSAAVELPSQLLGDRLRVSPLQNGWTVAIDRYLPPARTNAYCCKEIEEPESDEPGCCDDWVVAERSPRGRWVVQTLPHSRANRTWVSEPVEHHGRIELAWGEPYAEAVRVATAPLGKPLGGAHIVRHVLPHAHSESVSAAVKRGALYEVAEYGPDVNSDEPEFVVERPALRKRTTGPIHRLKSQLLYQRGTYFTEPDGGELDLYSAGDFKLLVARRAPFAGRFETFASGSSPSRRLARRRRRRVVQRPPADNRRNQAQAPPQPPEADRDRRGFATRLPDSCARDRSSTRQLHADLRGGDRGRRRMVVASTTDQGGPLWLHPSSPRCAYREQKLALTGASVSHGDSTLAMSAGRAGVFHIAWADDHDQLQTASVRVTCPRR